MKTKIVNLKKENISQLARLRALAKAPMSDDAKNGLRMAGAVACAAIESAWNELDANQLWTCFEKELTDDMRIGEHLAATRNALGLIA